NIQRSTTAGAVVISASYFPATDEATAPGLRATHWAIWLATGTDPDPESAPTAVIAMQSATGSSVERISWVSDAFADDTDGGVLVRRRRTIMGPGEEPEDPEVIVGEYDSTNTALLQIIASSVGPARPRGSAFLGRSIGVAV